MFGNVLLTDCTQLYMLLVVCEIAVKNSCITQGWTNICVNLAHALTARYNNSATMQSNDTHIISSKDI